MLLGPLIPKMRKSENFKIFLDGINSEIKTLNNAKKPLRKGINENTQEFIIGTFGLIKDYLL